MGLIALLPLLAAPAAAHLSIWHPSMYGFEADNRYAWEAIKPLYNLNFNEWWFHGDINEPPADGQIYELPAGGIAPFEVGCKKEVTTYGGRQNQHLSCDEWGPIHLKNGNDESDVKGCAIAIAYESNVHAIKPEDFTVISTNRSCPYLRDVTFEIPEQLPACPPGGCHCMWGWVHSEYGGAEEIYFTGFKCDVKGARLDAPPMPRAKPPTKCSEGGCTTGAKQPIYWVQKEGNNIHNPVYDPPYYNEQYGYANGAQHDIWAGSDNGGGDNNGRPTTTTDAQSSTSTSSHVWWTKTTTYDWEKTTPTNTWDDAETSTSTSSHVWWTKTTTYDWEKPTSTQGWDEESTTSTQNWESTSTSTPKSDESTSTRSWDGGEYTYTSYDPNASPTDAQPSGVSESSSSLTSSPSVPPTASPSSTEGQQPPWPQVPGVTTNYDPSPSPTPSPSTTESSESSEPSSSTTSSPSVPPTPSPSSTEDSESSQVPGVSTTSEPSPSATPSPSSTESSESSEPSSSTTSSPAVSPTPSPSSTEDSQSSWPQVPGVTTNFDPSPSATPTPSSTESPSTGAPDLSSSTAPPTTTTPPQSSSSTQAPTPSISPSGSGDWGNWHVGDNDGGSPACRARRRDTKKKKLVRRAKPQAK